MKKIAFAVAIAVASINAAHAEDWVRPEVGVGYSWSKDMGDGTWIQKGAPNNKEQTNAKAFLLGVTGRLYTNGPWSVDYHLDYVYFGQQTASVDGVPDDQYDPIRHVVHDMPAGERYSPFNGFGHVQGVPLTLDVGYTYDGFRLSAEGGMWAYWNTWHESLYALNNEWVHVQHVPKTQVGYVVGARVEKGPFAVSYRYYQVRADWSTGTPGLVTGTQMLMLQYKF
jgi:opacity protein-like surface antigen